MINSRQTPSFSIRATLRIPILAYANAINHPFVYDDVFLILKNAKIWSLANLPELIGFSNGGFLIGTQPV